MNELQAVGYKGQELAVTTAITYDTFERFISYLDASPKTIETYTKAKEVMYM